MTETFQRTFYYVAMVLAFFACVFWTYFNFLAAEDANVLFNRFNHLSGAPVLFYYAGYSSAFPQMVAFLLSWLPTTLQAILYSAVALLIFLTLLREVFLLTRSGLAVVFISAFCAVIYPAAIYNLTSSFWPGLVIVGLIGLRKVVHETPLGWKDVLFCLPGVLGSPLAIVFFPLYGWIFIVRRNLPSAIIAIGTLASYPLLTNHSGERGRTEGLFISLLDNTSQIFHSPLTYMLNQNSIADLAMSVLGSISVVTVLIVGTHLFFRTEGKIKKFALFLFLTGSVTTLVVAIAASSLPLQGRYWFPMVIAAIIVFFLYTNRIGLDKAFRKAQTFLVVLMVSLSIVSLSYRSQSWGGLEAGWSDWSLLASQAPNATAIIRERYNDGGRRAIGLGNFEMTYSECVGEREHPYSQDLFGFRIYCGENF